MSEMLGYGEDAFTFGALKRHLSEILEEHSQYTSGNFITLDC